MTPKGPLTGIRIMDFTWVMAGPHGTCVLGDLGAEVIKIEGRVFDRDGPRAKFFSLRNRNKLAISLNMRHPKGLEIAKRLLKISDGVIENFSAGVLERWGFGYEVMKSIKPDIIYVSMAGFGHSGPYRDYVSHGMTLHALSGFTYLSGVPGDIPLCTNSYADPTGGMNAAIAMLAAIEHRQQTGNGQHIDLAQLESNLAVLDTAFLDYFTNGTEPQPTANRLPHPASTPHGAYRCAGEERWIAISVFNERQWQALCSVMGNPEWIQALQFATMLQRVKNADELDRRLEEWTVTQTAEELMEKLQALGVPAGVVQNAQDLFEKDEHMRARGFWEWAEDHVFGLTPFEGQPIRMSNAQCGVRRGAPLFGEHNYYVYHDLLGMSKEEIEQRKAEGVFGEPLLSAPRGAGT